MNMIQSVASWFELARKSVDQRRERPVILSIASILGLSLASWYWLQIPTRLAGDLWTLTLDHWLILPVAGKVSLMFAWIVTGVATVGGVASFLLALHLSREVDQKIGNTLRARLVSRYTDLHLIAFFALGLLGRNLCSSVAGDLGFMHAMETNTNGWSAVGVAHLTGDAVIGVGSLAASVLMVLVAVALFERQRTKAS